MGALIVTIAVCAVGITASVLLIGSALSEIRDELRKLTVKKPQGEL